MRESGQDIWWRKTGQLAGEILAGVIGVSLVAAVVAAMSGGTSILGLPLGYVLFAIAAPLLILLAIFWFAERQRRFDDRYDVTGD
jgi:putative solute:sodium symporter small subunit